MAALNRRADLLTRREAAVYIGRSYSWLSRHHPENGGPPLLRQGRAVYYRKADLDR